MLAVVGMDVINEREVLGPWPSAIVSYNAKTKRFDERPSRECTPPPSKKITWSPFAIRSPPVEMPTVLPLWHRRVCWE
jgi:hypothetical protein